MSSTSTSDVALNLQDVRDRIQQTLEECNDNATRQVRLVAVSKTKPTEMLKQAYEAGQRYFGENYAQECMTKAEEMNSQTGFEGICWHFIGPLQSNKAAPLIKHLGTDLKCVETVSTLKLAQKLNHAVETLLKDIGSQSYTLGIYLQINTSGEDTKSGIEPDEITDLARDIVQSCPHLRILGVMTIGAPDDYTCFDKLAACRKILAEALGIQDETTLELSMGMSGDFEEAIRRGATNVRIGSTIFGARDYSKST